MSLLRSRDRLHARRNGRKTMKAKAYLHNATRRRGLLLLHETTTVDDHSVTIHDEYTEAKCQHFGREHQDLKVPVEVAIAVTWETHPGLGEEVGWRGIEFWNRMLRNEGLQKQWRARPGAFDLAYVGECEVTDQSELMKSIEGRGNGEADDSNPDFDWAYGQPNVAIWGDEAESCGPDGIEASVDRTSKATAFLDKRRSGGNCVIEDEHFAPSHRILPPKSRYAMVQASHDIWTPPERPFPFDDNHKITSDPRMSRSLDFGEA